MCGNAITHKMHITLDMFPCTVGVDLFPCCVDIQAIVSFHVETVVGLQRKDT